MTPSRILFWSIVCLAGSWLLACGSAEGPTEIPRRNGTQVSPGTDGKGEEQTTPVPGPAQASVQFAVADVPDCCSVPGGPYGSFGFRLGDTVAGHYALTDEFGAGSCNAPPQDPDNGITIARDGDDLNWTSTMPVAAVIVGSEFGANVYVYSPRSWGDDGLRAVVDPATGQPAAISSLEFCYDYALRVQLDVEASWTRSVQWELSQTLSQDSWELFPGDRAITRVDVSLDQAETSSNPPTIDGILRIENATPLPATVSSITNILSGGILVSTQCLVSFPFVLAPGESRECSYTKELGDTASRLNIVTVNTIGTVRGGTARENVVFGAQTTINESVHVEAPDGSEWGPFVDSADFSVERVFEASMIEGLDPQPLIQRSTIVETGQSTENPVTILRLQPTIAHEIAGSYQRDWNWTLERQLAITEILLVPGESTQVEGTLALGATARAQDFHIQGTLSVQNPSATRSLFVTGIEAALLSEAGVDACSAGSEIAPSGTLHCEFDTAWSDGETRSSFVQASYQCFDFGSDGSVTPTNIAVIEHETELVFEAMAQDSDLCVMVRDELAGYQAELCATAMPMTVPLVLQVGPYAGCESVSVDGSAELTANDSGAQLSSAYQLAVTMHCGESACTRGAGYWKSHGPGGPPPFDAIWNAVEGERLCGSGMGYVEILWSSVYGDPWMSLARQWVAARLNQVAGADPSAIAVEFAQAEAMLCSISPRSTLGTEQSEALLALKDVLWRWNSGEIGPGSCGCPH